jgi:hypothetical protein
MKLCAERRAQIKSEPLGDFWWTWSAELSRGDVPTIAEVLKAAEGRWVYKPVRLRLEVSNPPALLRLSVHTHHALEGVKREYLFPDMLMPPLKRGTFEWTFNAELTNHIYHVVLSTLPGDRVFLSLLSKHEFAGSLEVLFCGS